MFSVKPMMLSSIALSAALLLAACNTTGQNDMASDWSSVTGKDWQLTMVVDGDKMLSPTAPVVASANFAGDGKVSGSNGCNSYFGTYTQNAENLTFSPLGATRMACINTGMDVENAFNNATGQVANWQISDGMLVLSDSNGKAVMKFAPSAP